MNEYILAYTIGNDITGTVRISQEELHRSLQNLIREKVGNNAAVMQSLNTLAVQNGGNNDVRFLELAGDPNHGQDPQPQVAVVAVNQTVIDYTKFIRLCRIEAIDEINFQVREFQITTGEPFTGPGSVVEFFQQFTAREFQGLYLHDLVQFEIDHPALNTPFFIAPTSVGEFRIDDILDEIENVVASNTTREDDSKSLIKWYKENADMTYDLKAERAKYCENDVMILKKCCESFRELFKGITNFDPFSYTTLPAVSIADFRINHMIEDTIPIVYLPVQKNSKMAVQWLEYVAAKEGISIIHDANYGEYYFPDLHLWVDGYCDETKTIYSFLGCYFHACPQCYPNDRDRIDSRFGKTLNELFSDTKTRFKRLKKKGKIVVIWECEFKKLQNQPDFSIFKKDYKHIGRLNPRDAFYGGRTNATKLFYECKPGERIRDLDFTSIYSACMRNQKFPTCHPIILAGNDLKGKTDITEYFGLIKCTVVAPRKLYHPVLPVKTDKLCFPLCVLCCETQTRHCTHGWTKREFMGTWFSEELNLALEKGYRIIRLHEVHHFPETRTDLFNEYIEKWLKVKLESTGYLKHLKSEEEKLQYIEYIFVKEHIRLDPSKIIDNKGLRMIAKNMLNSLYGRFGQRPSYPETKYVNAKEDSALYNKIVFNRKKYEVRHIRKIGDDMVQICYDHRDVFKNKENFGSSVYIALMTSARARIKLYRLLDILGDRVIYFDTDSVKFVEQIGENLLPIGDGLGELTDEVDEGYYISRFISTGPKSLCYELTSIADMNDKKYIIKLKGITLNSGNLAKVNFDEMKKILLGENDVIKFVNLSKIVRNPSTLEIRNRVESKDYKLVYTKRVVQEDIKDGVEEGCVDTLPFGF